jgi:hypothetical protein
MEPQFRSVLSAVDDGQLEIMDDGNELTILERLPALENGDSQVSRASVSAGSKVVDTKGGIRYC